MALNTAIPSGPGRKVVRGRRPPTRAIEAKRTATWAAEGDVASCGPRAAGAVRAPRPAFVAAIPRINAVVGRGWEPKRKALWVRRAVAEEPLAAAVPLVIRRGIKPAPPRSARHRRLCRRPVRAARVREIGARPRRAPAFLAPEPTLGASYTLACAMEGVGAVAFLALPVARVFPVIKVA